MDTGFETRIDFSALNEKIGLLREQMARVIIGQRQVVDLLLTALLADGHVLIEGVPGVAKTLMAKVLSHLIEAGFCRIQFTPDLMPSDVLGTSVFLPSTGKFEFRQGLYLPIFYWWMRSTARRQRRRLPFLKLWKKDRLPMMV